ncbi:MAG: signal peptidase I [Deltaproteobacteria bacterium]|nr:signal peptidase I [Deltaproteobacteria bacterium]
MSRTRAQKAVQTTKADKKSRRVLWEYAQAIILAFILAMFIRTFVVQAFKIPSGSMLPTLRVGDHILVNKFLYGIKIPFTDKILIPITEPERGDIVVFVYPVDPSKDYIKRVIGLPGDKVEIIDKKVYINGQALNEPYVRFADRIILPKGVQPRDNFGPVIVPPGKIFVMGDNRDQSYDSRFWGFVDINQVKGKAFVIYWSWDSGRFNVRWSRLLNLIH